MPTKTTPNDRLDGWGAISEYLGWHVRTVIRWEKLKGLPVHRLAGGKRQPVYAYRHEIDRWFRETESGAPVASIPAGAIDTAAAGVLRVFGVGIPAAATITSQAAPINSGSPRRIPIPVLYLVGLASTALILLGISWKLETRPVLQITGVTQLSDDGSAKRHLITDGKQIYFREEIGDDRFVSTMSATGGAIRRLALTIPDPYPDDISPDGKLLLVESAVGIQEERQLWIAPAQGGSPNRVGGVQCHTAAWSPNGEWIAFGTGKAINLISKDGAGTRKLSQLDGVAESLQWSEDGRHLWFFLRNPATDASSLWGIDLDRSFTSGLPKPAMTIGEKCCRDDLLGKAKDGLLALENGSQADHILYLRKLPWWQGASSLEATMLSTHIRNITGLGADSTGRQIFLLSAAHEQGEAVRYEPSTQRFSVMLSGIPATHIDISKRSGLAAYVRTADGSLWVSKLDGSDAISLSPASMKVELPRWSPDGRWIAFMGKQVGRPFRIFLVRASGGLPKEATAGDDSQGAPTWSPDGRSLIYGNVRCLGDETCALHRIEVASAKLTTLPESQGLATARWSPDGRHIAALNSKQQELLVFDPHDSRWRRVASRVNGNDLSWSSDSSYLYFDTSIDGSPRIERVPLNGGPIQTVLTLDSFSHTEGRLDTWFALTPDNALVLNRWLTGSEIYALSYKD